ncbi:MAG: hypothetical protein ACXAEN_18420 [Candidatus Thorarchaeota archaeon]|jgi:hypothetical protein
MARSKGNVARRRREYLEKRGLPRKEIEEDLRRYMKEYELKEQHRKIHLEGTTGFERSKANARFEREVWPKIRKRLMEEE